MTDPERDAFDLRPTADEMLARVQADAPSGRGRLRIYLGMAPGVGKTFRMLDEGHRRVGRGTDLVVGFVETHGRTVVAARVDGLEVVPRRRIEYRGLVVEEMDTDAIIAREPTVALIDELAHTNVPGSARQKRWEDVEIIRDAGIHVVSTMNVQHLASVADAVATITGAPVNERLPDDVLLGADEIELVDMSPHALRQRMKHGNVYPPDRTEIALERFFTEANLTALRELALRVVARRVEGQLEGTSAAQQLPLITDRVVVLIDGSRASMRAVRRAAALAGALHAAFVGLVVETPEHRATAIRPDSGPARGHRRRCRSRRRHRSGRGPGCRHRDRADRAEPTCHPRRAATSRGDGHSAHRRTAARGPAARTPARARDPRRRCQTGRAPRR